MSVLAIILIFIGINIDTFIALLFAARRYQLVASLVGLTAAELVLWLSGVALGKTITTVFPDWITGFMGIVLIYLALRPDDQQVQQKKTGAMAIFLLCLSLGGDNLAVYIPWAGRLTVSQIALVTVLFTICSLITVLVVRLVARFKPIAFVLERYGNYCTNLVYLGAGIYIIWSSHLIGHLLALF